MLSAKTAINEYSLKSKEAVADIVIKYCGQFGDLVISALYAVIPEATDIKATVNNDSVEIYCRFQGVDKLKQEISRSWSLLSSLIKRGTVLSSISGNEGSLKAKIRLMAYHKATLNRLPSVSRIAG